MPSHAIPSEDTLNALRQALEAKFDHAVVAHDFQHLRRVERNAARLREREGGDAFVIGAACLLHDLHRILERDRGSYVAPEQADHELARLLAPYALDAAVIEHIRACIHATERYRCAGDTLEADAMSVEQRVVRDADMLDALGAIGIARAFMFGGHLGEPLWVAQEFADTFRHGSTTSVVHHFHEKLLRLHEEMLTDEGRRIALERTRLMHEYLDALRADLGVEGFAPRPPSKGPAQRDSFAPAVSRAALQSNTRK